MKRKKKSGFTFFELMFAIALFGLNFHIIYSQVMYGLRRMRKIKDRQELIHTMDQHLRFLKFASYQEVKTSIIELPQHLGEYEAQQIVVVKKPGLKQVELLVLDTKLEQRLLRFFTYKARAGTEAGP